VTLTVQQACALIVTMEGCWPAWLLACRALSLQCKEILYRGSLGSWSESECRRDPSLPWVSLSSKPITQTQYTAHPTWLCLVHSNDLSFIPSRWFQTRRFLATSPHPLLPHVLPLSHVNAGGVLEGQWFFHSNHQFQHQESDFPSAADSTHSIRHIINPTVPPQPACIPARLDINPATPPLFSASRVSTRIIG